MNNEGSYFSNEKKSEITELSEDLRSDRKDRKKDALKRIISSMTIGKDMSDLFPDVINLLQTDNRELKKLVYLYLINYSRTKPDLAILTVNTFVKDCDDPNPLVRALAVRTMGCIRVSKINEYYCEPLRKCMRDEDPYVRKTAAICVLKLFHFDPPLTIEQGFVDQLTELLKDANPMVITNALASLVEISQTAPEYKHFLSLGPIEVTKLLTALNECTEWGQTIILDALIFYEPESINEAQSICERVSSRLYHANLAVVLSTVRLILKMIKILPADHPMSSRLFEKLGPPLVSSLNAPPELQYVALRNINLIVQKYPFILKDELKSFFLKYNDPAYLKIEKLAIMIKLVTEENVDLILAELNEYASEVDVDIVRKSVRAIGTCALKVEEAADRCVTTLLNLIHTKVTYVVQEAVIVARDIMRKYPGKYESLIETLGDNLFSLDDPEARAALIWIMGEYSNKVENAGEVLRHFVESFQDESSNVQLQLLTAVVKLFLRRPSENQELVENLLTMVTQQIDNPDIRDRGFFYWRLLSTDPSAAKEIVLAQKPAISPESDNLDPSILEELLLHLASLSSVYHKLPNLLMNTAKRLKQPIKNHFEAVSASQTILNDNEIKSDERNMISSTGLELLNFDFCEPIESEIPSSTTQNFDPLTDIFSSIGLNQGQEISQQSFGDIFSSNLLLTDLYTPPPTLYDLSSTGSSLQISGQFSFSPSLSLSLTIENKSLGLYSFKNPSIKIGNNYFGLVALTNSGFPPTLGPLEKSNIILQLNFAGINSPVLPVDFLSISLNTGCEVLSFSACFPFHYYFKGFQQCSISQEKFRHQWDSLPSNCKKHHGIKTVNLSLSDVQSKFKSINVFPLNLSTNSIGGHLLLINNVFALILITIESFQPPKCVIGSNSPEILDALSRLLQILNIPNTLK